MRQRDVLREALANLLKDKEVIQATRLAIMIYLAAKGEVSFSTLTKELGLSPGNAWSHLEKLRKLGLVNMQYVLGERNKVMISLTERGYALLNEIILTFNGIARKLGNSINSRLEGTEGSKRD